MLIYGAGGHAKVLMSILAACGKELAGIFDDDPGHAAFRGYHVLHRYDPDFLRELPLIIAIGDNLTRKKMAECISHGFGTAIHPSARLDGSVGIGKGSVVVHGAIIQADTTLGEHVIVNTGARVDHDCSLSDFVHIGPGATLCGNVSVGECTLVGAGSVVMPGIRIGHRCKIGAGAVVLSDVPDDTKVAGNPARIII